MPAMRFVRFLPLLLCLGVRAQQVDVFVVIGQSNAVGVGVPAHLPDGFTLPDRVRLLGGAMRDHDSFGPELGLAERLAAALPDRRLAIVKHATSGTSLHTDWRPGLGEWDDQGFGPEFTKFRNVLARDLAALRGEGLTPVVRGVVWVQGEADARGDAPPDAAARYGDRLAAFVRRVRTTVGSADLPFVIVQVLPKPVERMAHRDEIRAAQAEVAQRVPFTFLVPTDDVALRADEADTKLPDDLVHFGSAGLIEIGHRAADALLPRCKGDGGSASLFNGQDLTGWIVDGRDDSARAVDGELRLAAGARISTERVHGDFVLEFEAHGDLGVLVTPETLPAVGARRPAGAVLRASLREWTPLRLTCTGGVLELRDGERALQHERTPSRSPGHIRLSADNGEVVVRHVTLREADVPVLPGNGDEGFDRVDAFRPPPPRGDDGAFVLTGTAIASSEATFAGDFELVVDWRAAKGDTAAWRLQLGGAGVVTLLGDGRIDATTTGAPQPATGDGAWHRLRAQRDAAGLHCAVDGREPTTVPAPANAEPAPIGLEPLAGKVGVANVYVRARQQP